MARKKSFRFQALHEFPNGFSEEEAQSMKGSWRKEYFKNDNPIILELACGKGDYALGLGALYPDKNFIGIDVKGDRLYIGIKSAFDRGDSPRIGFIRGHIEFIESYFGEGEIDEIWITFPDPRARKSEIKNRLTAPIFLDRYSRILTKEGKVHVKTDTTLFYFYTKEMVEQEDWTMLEDFIDISEERKGRPDLDIKTAYEKKHLEQGRVIKYLTFKPNR